MNSQLTMALTLRKRLLLLCLIFIVCFFIVTILAVAITMVFGSTTPALRITTVLQDVILFITPPVLTAVIVCRRPAQLLCISRMSAPSVTIWMLVAMIASIPAMDYIVYLNENVPLPDGLAASLRAMEDGAQAAVAALIGPHDIPNLIVTILIVGIFAGVSEELLFRGGLQRLMVTGGVNHHVAIWVSAMLFSLLHMQFYGFVPRILLGAFFGYALWWSGSLWLPIILHALNNTLYVITEYVWGADASVNNIGKDNLVIILISVALTACALYIGRRTTACHIQRNN